MALFGQNNVVARSAAEGYFQVMKGLRYIYWQDGRFWLGYLEEYPDYLTQGESLKDLQEHLRDLYADLSGGHIPAVRKVAELELA
ncbi:MAG TPA: type II toxin-antitoxin system HicB family antitoxin [Verrucomicrobiae bacterium]|nr:type II toxin-antitoxin system HicB family antitoxin [Verrucomicrobiae bacterium]